MTDATARDQLTRLVSGYWISQMVYAAARLGLADLLAEGARTVDELASATASHPHSLHRLLRALASVGVFSEGAGASFSLTPLAEPLRADVPGSLHPAVLMMVGQFSTPGAVSSKACRPERRPSNRSTARRSSSFSRATTTRRGSSTRP